MEYPELHVVEDGDLHFLLSVPPDDPPEGWPLLCFLHGLDEGPPTDLYVGIRRHGPLKPGSSPRATRDFIVVAPQVPKRGDTWRDHAKDVLELIRKVQSEHGGDPSRCYLTGFSFGGNGVFDLALQEPSIWAALWTVDPTRVPPKDPGLPVWLSSGEASRPNARRFIDRLRLQPPGTPDSDERIYVDEGLDHVRTATSAYRDVRILEWLLTKQRAS